MIMCTCTSVLRVAVYHCIAMWSRMVFYWNHLQCSCHNTCWHHIYIRVWLTSSSASDLVITCLKCEVLQATSGRIRTMTYLILMATNGHRTDKNALMSNARYATHCMQVYSLYDFFIFQVQW